jgi:hypothetical protein
MKHLFKFESFDDFSSDPMEKITLQEYADASNHNYNPFTERELQVLTDFCNRNGFKVQARPKEVKPEVKKGRFDKFKDYVSSKFGGKKEEAPSGPSVSKEFIILIPNDMPGLNRFREENLHRLHEIGRSRNLDRWRLSGGQLGDYTMIKVFKSLDEFIYMEFGMSEFNQPVVRDCYRFDYMKTLFKFVEDLVK